MDEAFEAQPTVSENVADLRTYARVLLRRKWIIIGAVALFVAAGLAYVVRGTRVYSARTTVIIEPSAPNFLDEAQVGDVKGEATVSQFPKEYYQTQYEIITSREVAQRVVDRLGLAANDAFLGLDGIPDPAKRAERRKRVDTVARLQAMVRVSPIKESRVVELTVNDVDPARAALLSNALADAYIDETLDLKSRLTDRASKWLEDRLAQLADQSRKSELDLYDFKKRSDILTVSLEDRANILSQRLVAVSTALTQADLDITHLTAREKSIAALRASMDGGNWEWTDPLPVEDDARGRLLAQLKQDLNKVRGECAELRQRYLETHPLLAACELKLQTAEGALSNEAQNLVATYEVSLREAKARQTMLQSLLGQTKAEAFEIGKREIEYDRLKRGADNDQRLHEAVLKRAKDLELSGMLRTSNVRVLDRAVAPLLPIRPNPPLTLALVLMCGLVVGVAGALLVEWQDDSVRTERDVEVRVGVPFLGAVPAVKLSAWGGSHQEKDLHLHFHPESPAAEQCRSVRTKLLFTSPEGPFHTMVVTSPGPQEGKSTHVINLGIAMAQSGSRVLLVDPNLRNPRLHEAFGVPDAIGVTSVLKGEHSKAEAVRSTDVPNLFVLPSGPIPLNPAELLHTGDFERLLVDLSTSFDRIILDSPPLGTVSDALVLSTHADCVLLVLRANHTHRGQARRVVKELQQVHARVVGAVLNTIDTASGALEDAEPVAPAVAASAPSTPVRVHESQPQQSAATGDRA